MTTNIYAPAVTKTVNFTGDFSGTYISSTPDSVVKISQDGNKISGSYSWGSKTGGKIWGDIEGNTISYDWTSPTGGTGTGKLSFTIGSSEVTDTWASSGSGSGKTNLIKVE